MRSNPGYLLKSFLCYKLRGLKKNEFSSFDSTMLYSNQCKLVVRNVLLHSHTDEIPCCNLKTFEKINDDLILKNPSKQTSVYYKFQCEV